MLPAGRLGFNDLEEKGPGEFLAVAFFGPAVGKENGAAARKQACEAITARR